MIQQQLLTGIRDFFFLIGITCLCIAAYIFPKIIPKKLYHFTFSRVETNTDHLVIFSKTKHNFQ